MWSWFRRKRSAEELQKASTPLPPPPAPLHEGSEEARLPPRLGGNPANPGNLSRGHFSHERGGRTWTEPFDCGQMLAGLIEKYGGQPQTDPDSGDVTDLQNDLRFRPLLVDFVVRDDGSAQTVTTIEVTHPTLLPRPIFEFQHSWGASISESMEKGFDAWCQLDLPVLRDALVAEPLSCNVMTIDLRGTDAGPPRRRRILLGPVGHFRETKTPDGVVESHPFCPCCLFTNAGLGLKPLFDLPGAQALRLFASRDRDGQATADCRVNGEDFLDGRPGLEKYAESWLHCGFEYRKQYVLIHDVPMDDSIVIPS